ncbi:MAG: ABC-2 transporter permease [Clostridia bacterium]|nr:ABC-2 transporter permease [Clostridia bacterium]
MKDLLYKEFRLCMPMQIPLFFLFACMLFIPNYPYVVAGFFICNAIFYSFTMAAADSDLEYSLSLPVSKKQIVGGKQLFVALIQFAALLIFGAAAALSFFAAGPRTNNAGCDGSLTLLGGYLLLFSVFNVSFLPGYYKAPRKTGKRFLISIIYMFLFIILFEGFMIASEAAGELAFFSFIKTYFKQFPQTPGAWGAQALFFVFSAAVYAVMNLIGFRRSVHNFERLDI